MDVSDKQNDIKTKFAYKHDKYYFCFEKMSGTLNRK